VLRLVGAARGVAHPLLALVPIAAFVAQEAAERAVSGTAPTELLAEPAFGVGLAVQAVCGLAAFVLSRLLVEGADRLGRIVATRTALVPQLPVAVPAPVAADVLRARALAFPHAGRAPPALAS
jgi:hypothetical protein